MVSDKTVEEIIEKDGNPLISITMPTHRVGEEIKQDPIRLKNLLTDVSDTLTDRGMKQPEIDEILKPAKELLEQPIFWSHQDSGLVVYLAKGYFNYFQLPFSVQEKAYVNTHFLITPILPMVSLDGRFNVLAISRKDARLLRCTRNEATDITPDSATTNIDDYQEVVQEKQLQFHSGANRDKTMFFGHGNREDNHRGIIEAYFRELEKDITTELKKENNPLVLVGLEDNLGYYKSINSYKRTVDDAVNANPDDMKEHDLKETGWEKIQNFFLKDMYNSLDQFTEQTSAKVSNNLSEVIESTVMGKSKNIFISMNEDRWGHYDEDNHEVHLTDEPSNEDVDLLNWLAVKGIETGSNVYILPRDEMPMKSTVAAEFRF
ncbi:baeRF7 domain-containing protein [Rhodohalobacter sp. 8-1]|uniref:baeRF7 domain-containing protein n=1 Tax=Rhodohalobacter sp. 8-1 TaxID=3131972 RepID=UPI0030EE26E9